MNSFRRDIRIGGVINIILYLLLNFIIQKYLETKTSAFDGFKLYHHILWYTILILQNIYILLILLRPDKYSTSLMSKAIYRFFTVGGIDSFKGVLIASEKEPLSEYILLLVFILIPWPILKTVSMKNRFMLLFSKIGIFHFITSLILLNWKTQEVEYKVRSKEATPKPAPTPIPHNNESNKPCNGDTLCSIISNEGGNVLDNNALNSMNNIANMYSLLDDKYNESIIRTMMHNYSNISDNENGEVQYGNPYGININGDGNISQSPWKPL